MCGTLVGFGWVSSRFIFGLTAFAAMLQDALSPGTHAQFDDGSGGGGHGGHGWTLIYVIVQVLASDGALYSLLRAYQPPMANLLGQDE